MHSKYRVETVVICLLASIPELCKKTKLSSKIKAAGTMHRHSFSGLFDRPKANTMDRMTHLRELLAHDIQMLYSAEQQIIEAMPAMIAKAHNSELKQALEQHLEVTEHQSVRIDRVRELLGADEDSVKKYTGVLAKFMGGSAKCKGIEGLIDEGQKVMAENLSPEVMDAAIIAANQKIEHYEIAGYGTARTYAQQLGLTEVANLLQQTLDEEYAADDTLTNLAVSSVNLSSEIGTTTDTRTNR